MIPELDHSRDPLHNSPIVDDYEPPSGPWGKLCDLAPNLATLHRRSWNSNANPQPLNDGLFIALAACLAHKQKREILRALILDLLADDLQEIIVAFLTEEIDAKSN